jgi:hypothetical protein
VGPATVSFASKTCPVLLQDLTRFDESTLVFCIGAVQVVESWPHAGAAEDEQTICTAMDAGPRIQRGFIISLLHS